MKTDSTMPANSTSAQEPRHQQQPEVRAKRSSARPSHGRGLEVIDSILWRLQSQGAGDKSLLVGITGCRVKAGATTVASHLALQAGRRQSGRVLLVDAGGNAHSGRRFGQRRRRESSASDLSDILSGEVSPRECEPTEVAANVFALSSGTLADGATRVNSQLIAEMLDEFRSQYHTVIVDLPAADRLHSALPLAKQLPGVLLVVRSEKVQRRQAQRVLERLAEDGVCVCGTVLNRHHNYVPRLLRNWF